MNLLHEQKTYDLDNWADKRRAAGLVYTVAARACEGRLSVALMGAELPYNWQPEIDGRTAEAKEYHAAETALWEALRRYDNARLAAIAKAKS